MNENAVHTEAVQTALSFVYVVGKWRALRHGSESLWSHSALRPDSAFSASRRRLSSSSAAWVSGYGMVRRRRLSEGPGEISASH